jgi:regulatory protein
MKLKSLPMKIKPENSNPPNKSAHGDVLRGKKRAIKQPKKITRDYLHNSGLYYLQRFSSSVANFESVMTRKIKKSCKAHPEQDFSACIKLLEDLIVQFQRAGLLNDQLYSEGMVSSLRRRGHSKQAIRQKLSAKGLDGGLINEKLETHDSLIHQEPREAELGAAIKMAHRKKWGPFDKTGRRTPEKTMAAMARAGFSYDIIAELLKLNTEEAEDRFYRRGS